MLARVLNIGAGPGDYLPERYRKFDVVTLDNNPRAQADLNLDARMLHLMPKASFDGAISFHTLEHFYEHEVHTVLSGIFHVLKPGGTLEIIVPDIISEVLRMEAEGYTLHSPLFATTAGPPIRLLDIIYGMQSEVRAGNAGMAHKTAFSLESLEAALKIAGFDKVSTHASNTEGFCEIYAYGFKPEPEGDDHGP